MLAFLSKAFRCAWSSERGSSGKGGHCICSSIPGTGVSSSRRTSWIVTGPLRAASQPVILACLHGQKAAGPEHALGVLIHRAAITPGQLPRQDGEVSQPGFGRVRGGTTAPASSERRTMAGAPSCVIASGVNSAASQTVRDGKVPVSISVLSAAAMPGATRRKGRRTRGFMRCLQNVTRPWDALVWLEPHRGLAFEQSRRRWGG